MMISRNTISLWLRPIVMRPMEQPPMVTSHCWKSRHIRSAMLQPLCSSGRSLQSSKLLGLDHIPRPRSTLLPKGCHPKVNGYLFHRSCGGTSAGCGTSGTLLCGNSHLYFFFFFHVAVVVDTIEHNESILLLYYFLCFLSLFYECFRNHTHSDPGKFTAECCH